MAQADQFRILTTQQIAVQTAEQHEIEAGSDDVERQDKDIQEDRYAREFERADDDFSKWLRPGLTSVGIVPSFDSIGDTIQKQSAQNLDGAWKHQQGQDENTDTREPRQSLVDPGDAGGTNKRNDPPGQDGQSDDQRDGRQNGEDENAPQLPITKLSEGQEDGTKHKSRAVGGLERMVRGLLPADGTDTVADQVRP